MKLEIVALKTNDNDLTKLAMIHKEPSISRFISISDNYFEYVTNTDGVTYYKIIFNDVLVGGLQTEIKDKSMCLCICVDEKYRRKRIAETALKQLIEKHNTDIKDITVYIDNTNLDSIALFTKLGFYIVNKSDDETIMQKVI